MRTHTTAPEAYDGFGTKTVARDHIHDSKGIVRTVETPSEHIEWQRLRYASGGHLALTDDGLAESIEYGFIKKMEVGS